NDEINAICLGTLFDQEVVAAVFETGRVIIWKLDLAGTILYTYKNSSSTWGCAIHGETNTIAISANSHNITILEPPGPPTDAPAQLRLKSVLEDHIHNIPNVSFSACGKYLVSASIDSSIRAWDLDSGTPICSYFDRHWCWSALFVYPFYFVPDSLEAGGSTDTERAGVLSDLSAQLMHYIQTTNAGIDTEDGSQSEEVDWEVVDEEEGDDDDDEPTPRSALQAPILDHSDDIQNGHTPTTGSDIRGDSSESHSDDQPFFDAEDGGQASDAGLFANHGNEESLLTDSAIAADTTSIERRTPLILCGTDYDIVLMDPAKEYMPVVDKIPFAVLGTSGPWLESMEFFDRIAFLEWIPELGIAITASYSGNAAIIELKQQASSGPKSSNDSCSYKVTAKLLEPIRVSNRLYGIAVYRRSVDRLSQYCSVVVYVVYMDGTMHVYELSLEPSEYFAT
ncbi:hypothetical protein EC988_001651, partial [Linderina pennispora]